MFIIGLWYTLCLLAFCLFPLAVSADDDRDYLVTGGTEGTDYTYENGVLTFLKNGSYTVSMSGNAQPADDRIVVNGNSDRNPGFDRLNLTLDQVNIDTGSQEAISGYFGNRTKSFNWTVILKGKNEIKSTKATWHNNSNYLNLTIQAESGSTSDSLDLQYGNTDTGLYAGNITFSSGKINWTGSGGSDIIADKTIQIDDGELNVKGDSPNGLLYCNHAFIMNGGDVTIENSKSICINIATVSDYSGNGLVVNGGNLTLTSLSTSRFKGTITTGSNNDSSAGTYKNVVFNTKGKVTINSKSVGIKITNQGSLSMKQGTLQINAAEDGIYMGRGGNGPGGVSFSGGETEITSSNPAMIINPDEKISPKKVTPALTLSKESYTYDGKAKTPEVTVKDGESTCKKDRDYSVAFASGRKNVGKYKVTVTMKGNYSGSASKTFKINKAANPLKIKAKNVTINYKKLQTKNQTRSVGKVISFKKKGKGKMKYNLSSAIKRKKNYKDYFKMNVKTGKVTVKKSLGKGTYKVKVKVKAAGNKNYKASKQKTLTIKFVVK